ncbi:MAG TPA: hypothetical protein VFB26_03375 [Gaiellaceae bacterium]|nr:hypothetical protein [Gaiellaceae bacterium]
MEPLPDLTTLSDDDLQSMIRTLEREEDGISFRRRVLHGRIDILRGELVSRLRRQVSSGETLPEHEPGPLERSLFEGRGDVPEEHELEPLPDLDTLSDEALRHLIHELEREEDDISLRRRFLHGQIDILRAARYQRLRSGALDVAQLARVLSGHVEGDPGETG